MRPQPFGIRSEERPFQRTIRRHSAFRSPDLPEDRVNDHHDGSSVSPFEAYACQRGSYPGSGDAALLIGCNASGAPKAMCAAAGLLRIPAHPLHQAGAIRRCPMPASAGGGPEVFDHGDD